MLDKNDLQFESDDVIKEKVEGSIIALSNLIQTPLINENRLPNSENNLYLKLLEKATVQENLQMVRMDSLNRLVIIRKKKS